MNAITQLCPNCGLCCDSTLFADVKLRPADDLTELKKLGLRVKKMVAADDEPNGQRGEKSLSQLMFTQPCSCFNGKFCEIYGGRPGHCRLFECGLLKKVIARRMSARTALAKISRAKALAAKVRSLLDVPSPKDQASALIKRYTRAMEKAIDLGNNRDAARRGKLMLAMDDLMRVVQRDFLK